MTPAPFLLVAARLVVAGCATTAGSKLPVCDGKHLRPANPHGSVLDPSTSPTPAARAAEATEGAHPGCGQ